MNIQILADKIREFLTVRVSIYKWDLDYPDILYYKLGGNKVPANTMISLPVQNIVHDKDSKNVIITEARFPYRLTYRYPGQIEFDNLPWRTFEGMLSFLHIISLIQAPDPRVEDIKPAALEDSITVSRVGEQKGDWLVHLNFAYDTRFRTTIMPDVSELQPDYWSIDTPLTIAQITARINRAKPDFDSQVSSTYTEDNTLIININPQ